MTLQQLIEKGMNTDITPLLQGLKTYAIFYVIAQAVLFVFVLVFFVVVSWQVFKGFRNFNKFDGDFK